LPYIPGLIALSTPQDSITTVTEQRRNPRHDDDKNHLGGALGRADVRHLPETAKVGTDFIRISSFIETKALVA
jgi:hypothetical protein